MPHVTAGALLALTLPGLLLGLLVLAVVEQVTARRGHRSRLAGSTRPRLSAAGFDVFSAAVSPGRAAQLEQRRVEAQLRDDEADGAPPRAQVDLDRRVVVVRRGQA